MQKEGFDPTEMEPQEAVTILDKIKAELARSGQHIVGYTDEFNASVFDFHGYGTRAAVHGVFHQFLYHTGGAFYHFAGSDLADYFL